jgi:CPA1 family monovalent cation:H+ antiporter
VAVLAVAQRLPIPHQALAIVSAEALFNDATALVAYSFALTATISGTFSLEAASLRFVAVVVGGVVIGVAVGLLYERVMRHVEDIPLGITVSLFLPFAAYLPADAIGASGVLAAVIAGLYGGWQEATMHPAAFRLSATAVWGMLVFLLNAFLFILVGLEFPTILHAISRQSSIALTSGYASLISLTLILVRLVWVVLTSYTPSVVHLFPHPRNQLPDWRTVAVVAWAGPRGAISLAAALTVPFAVPSRGLIIHLTFGVILATLGVQGLSLPVLIRWLGLGEEGIIERDEARAWVVAAQTALRELENPDIVDGAPPGLVEDLRRLYEHQLRYYRPMVEEGAKGGERSIAMRPPLPSQQLRRQLIEAERRAVIELRDQGTIGDEAFQRVERDLDLEELRVR